MYTINNSHKTQEHHRVRKFKFGKKIFCWQFHHSGHLPQSPQMTTTDPQDSNGGNSGPNSINGTEGRISSGYSINGILGIQHSNDPNVNTMKRKRVDDHGELGKMWAKRNGRKTHAFPEKWKTWNFLFAKKLFEATAKGSFIVVVTVSVFCWMSIALVVHRKADLLFVFLLIALCRSEIAQ